VSRELCHNPPPLNTRHPSHQFPSLPPCRKINLETLELFCQPAIKCSSMRLRTSPNLEQLHACCKRRVGFMYATCISMQITTLQRMRAKVALSHYACPLVLFALVSVLENLEQWVDKRNCIVSIVKQDARFGFEIRETSTLPCLHSCCSFLSLCYDTPFQSTHTNVPRT
jgi:hypothetical protein